MTFRPLFALAAFAFAAHAADVPTDLPKGHDYFDLRDALDNYHLKFARRRVRIAEGHNDNGKGTALRVFHLLLN